MPGPGEQSSLFHSWSYYLPGTLQGNAFSTATPAPRPTV